MIPHLRPWTVELTFTFDFDPSLTVGPITAEITTSSFAFSYPLPNAIVIGPVGFASSDTNGGTAYVNGPTLSLSTEAGSNPTFGIETGINFLNTNMAAATVGLTWGPKLAPATGNELQISTDVTTPVLFGEQYTLTFGYTPSQGLSIEGFTGFAITDALTDWWSEIQDKYNSAPGTSACKRLAQSVVQGTFSSSYTLTPSVTIEGGSMVFSLTGTFELTVAGISSLSIEPENPIVVEVPSSTQFSDLPTVLTSGITDQLINILYENKEKMGAYHCGCIRCLERSRNFCRYDLQVSKSRANSRSGNSVSSRRWIFIRTFSSKIGYSGCHSV